MAHKIKWSVKAASQLEQICNFIGSDSEFYAALFAKRIISIVKAIPRFPKAGRKVPEYNN